MFKRFTQIFLLGMLCFSFNAVSAQEDATIDPENILFWIGEGQHEAIFIVNWNEPDTALAWGYRFDESEVTAQTMMNAIAAVDNRITYDLSGGFINDIFFDDGYISLSLKGDYFLTIHNGSMSASGIDGEMLNDGDYFKVGDVSCATDLGNWHYIWTKPVAPVYPLADDATIAAEDILYWVGEGPNEAILIVNWNDPDTALAWGYRFSNDSVTLENIMIDIAANDSRFAYTAANGFLSNITFNEGTVSLTLTGQFWMFNVNGTMAMVGFDQAFMKNGDYAKWGDEACATDLGHWNYVWTTPVTPVGINTSVSESASVAAVLYPNPATTESWLAIEGNGEDYTVTVSDIQGRVLNTSVLNVYGKETVRIDASNLTSGMYFVTVNNGVSNKVIKLAVQ